VYLQVCVHCVCMCVHVRAEFGAVACASILVGSAQLSCTWPHTHIPTHTHLHMHAQALLSPLKARFLGQGGCSSGSRQTRHASCTLLSAPSCATTPRSCQRRSQVRRGVRVGAPAAQLSHPHLAGPARQPPRLEQSRECCLVLATLRCSLWVDFRFSSVAESFGHLTHID